MKSLIALTLAGLLLRGDKPVTFQYAFKKGQLLRYHIEIETHMGMDANASMDTSMHVDDVKDDGSALLTTKIDNGHISMHGFKIKMPGAGKEFQLTVDKYGKTMEAGEPGKATVHIQEFPDHAIKVGESWGGKMFTSGGRSNVEANAHFTLESVKTEAGHTIAHVLVTEEGQTTGKGSFHLQATGYMDWDATDCVVKRVHLEGTEDAGKVSGPFTSDETPIEDAK